MMEYAITAKEQLIVVLRNIYSQFRKECAIPAINVITRQYRSIILIHIYSLFIKECNIPAISVTTMQNKRLVLRNKEITTVILLLKHKVTVNIKRNIVRKMYCLFNFVTIL